VYQRGAEKEAQRWEPWFGVPTLPRWQMTWQFLNQVSDISSIIDYGCGTGYHGVHLVNEIDRPLSFTGVDFDPSTIDQAKRLAARRARVPESINFVLGTHDIEPVVSMRAHCVIMQETLEHVLDPFSVLDWARNVVAPEGWCIITVPFGPLEMITLVRDLEAEASHVREWTPLDLNDIFGNQRDLTIRPFALWKDAIYGIQTGFTWVSFRFSPVPLGQINWARKLNQSITTALALPW
jgi:SAM-dependent methyltransferase